MFAAALAPIFLPLWVIWIGLFGVIEGAAFWERRYYPDRNRDGGTLSELVWRLIRGYQWYHRVALVLFIAFWLWLTIHFFG